MYLVGIKCESCDNWAVVGDTDETPLEFRTESDAQKYIQRHQETKLVRAVKEFFADMDRSLGSVAPPHLVGSARCPYCGASPQQRDIRFFLIPLP